MLCPTGVDLQLRPPLASHHPVQLEDDAAFMDKYSRQIGAFGLEAMSKLMNLKVLIVGLRCVCFCFSSCLSPYCCSMGCMERRLQDSGRG